MPARGVTLAKIEAAERAAIALGLGRFTEPEEPATGSPYALDQGSDAADLESRRRAGARRISGWAARMVEERSRFLLRIAEGIQGEGEAFARAERIH